MPLPSAALSLFLLADAVVSAGLHNGLTVNGAKRQKSGLAGADEVDKGKKKEKKEREREKRVPTSVNVVAFASGTGIRPRCSGGQKEFSAAKLLLRLTQAPAGVIEERDRYRRPCPLGMNTVCTHTVLT